MANATVVDLPGIRLPENGALLRDYTREAPTEYYLANYDNRTVIYDAAWREDLKCHVLATPPFFNLWDPFKAGLSTPSDPVRIRKRIEWKRSEQVFLDGPKDGIQVTLDGHSYALPSRPAEAPRFAGLRCAVTLNKNNDLQWIHDWAHFHVHRHGMEGVALVDNGSTDYSVEDVRQTLASVDGLKEAVVYSARFPYGPLGHRGGKKNPLPKFFQSAMLNLARDDALPFARSVLNCDIDEMVLGPKGVSIFEATEKHPLGMITFLGYWAYPEDMSKGACAQRDHVYRELPMKKVNRKWCLAPNKFIGRNWLWDVHQVGGILQNWFTTSRVFSHAHCRACSTGWRPNRFKLDAALTHDAALETEFQGYLPATGAPGA